MSKKDNKLISTTAIGIPTAKDHHTNRSMILKENYKSLSSGCNGSTYTYAELDSVMGFPFRLNIRF